ncbi:hypothetical protein DSO57_1019359 [Entomophthora muscae]|uniref:Uncharacterized protein n=1 Tax=Entomophthora muscae TaxID=34485 RepID=A0ACC2U1T5_9FUNG|nr:hypothetical protein DSO57_1019359 [Entomophthora muscae]
MVFGRKDNRSRTLSLTTWNEIGHVISIGFLLVFGLIPEFSHWIFYVCVGLHGLLAPISLWFMWAVRKVTATRV